MRFIFLYLLLFATTIVQAQEVSLANSSELIKISPTFWAKPDKVYLDSIEIDLAKTYLSARNIKSIKTFKDNINRTKSAVIITRKNVQPLFSLNNLIREEPKEDRHLPVIFVINKTPIEDTSGVSIEVSAIKSIDILKDSDKTISNNPRKIVYIIHTKDKKDIF